MKKFISLLCCFITVCMIASCSNEMNKVLDASREPHVEHNVRTYTFNNDSIKTLGTVKVKFSHETHSKSLDINDKNILFYVDGMGKTFPLVFEDGNGNYMVFTIEESFTIGSDTIACNVNGLYLSDIIPEFISSGFDINFSEEITVPILEFFSSQKVYMFNGQIIIDVNKGKVFLLNSLDFTSFQLGNDGIYRNSEMNQILKFDFDSTRIIGSDVIMKSIGDKQALYKISMDNHTDKIFPLSNSDYFSAYNIIAGNPDVLVVLGKNKGSDIGNYLLDINGIVGPKKLMDDGYSYDNILNDIGYGISGVGTFKNEVLLNDKFWNIQSVDYIKKYFKTIDNHILSHPLAAGFTLDGEYVASNYIDNLDVSSVTFNGKTIEILKDSEGFIYTESQKTHPLSDLNREPVYDYRKLMKKGFYIGNSFVKPDRVEYGFYDVNQTRYDIVTDAEGNVYSASQKVYPLKTNGNRIADYTTMIGGFNLDGNIIHANSLSAEGFWYGDFFYRFHYDEWGFIYVMKPTETAVKDINGNILHDDRIQIRNGFYIDDKKIVVSSSTPSFTEIKDSEGNVYYISSDNSNGRYKVSFKNINYFRDGEGHAIESIERTILKGIRDIDGSLIDCMNISDSGMMIDNIYYKFFYDVNGKIYIRSNTNNVLAVTEIVCDADLNLSIGRKCIVRLENNSLAHDDYKLINITQGLSPNSWILYCYKQVSNSSGNLIAVVEFNSSECSLNVLSINNIESVCIPYLECQGLNSMCWDNRNKSLVWSEDRTVLFWINETDNTINSFDFKNMLFKTSVQSKNFASSVLARIGNNLIFSLYDSASSVGTYSLDINNIYNKPVVLSSSNMSVLSLVELNEIDF